MLSARSMASCGWTPPVASATLALKSEDEMHATHFCPEMRCAAVCLKNISRILVNCKHTLGLGGTLFLDELADGWKGTLLPQLKTPISIHDIWTWQSGPEAFGLFVAGVDLCRPFQCDRGTVIVVKKWRDHRKWNHVSQFGQWTRYEQMFT